MLQQIDNKAVAKRIHIIIDRLRKYEGIAQIDMDYVIMPIINKHGCMTPGCFMGWYLHDIEYCHNMDKNEENKIIFGKGVGMFEREILDLPDSSRITAWYQFDAFVADSGLWHNDKGIYIYTCSTAYTGEECSSTITLGQILDCWGKFANNLNASNKKYFIKV